MGAAATVAAALPAVKLAPPAIAQEPAYADALLQAFADTMIPGRRVDVTVSGQPIHPQAIAGVDDEPGAVEADALMLYHHPLIGFDTLAPPFLADLALHTGGDFVALDYAGRERACLSGLSFDNPLRVLWEAAAAVPFTAFCAAGVAAEQSAEKAPGYRVMGLPGAAPAGYWDFSYRRRLARERTRKGYLD